MFDIIRSKVKSNKSLISAEVSEELIMSLVDSLSEIDRQARVSGDNYVSSIPFDEILTMRYLIYLSKNHKYSQINIPVKNYLLVVDDNKHKRVLNALGF